MKFNQWYSRIIVVGYIWLCSDVVASANGRRLCGFHLSRKVMYDPSVEECKDGTVVPRTTTPTLSASTNGRRLCGFHLSRKVMYDPSVEECKDGTVVPRTTTSTLSASTNGRRLCGFHPSRKVMYDPSIEECKDGTVVPRTTTSTLPVSANGRRLCGFHQSRKVMYDPSIEECKDGTVVPRTTTSTLPEIANGGRLCGFHPSHKVMYDPSVEECKDGTVVPRTTTHTLSDKPTTVPTKSGSTPNPATGGAFEPTEDVLKGRNCTEKRIPCGYKCCGPGQVYHPDFETCCREMSKVQIYRNSPEKENICCGTHIYPRSKPRCRHPALNDRLWDTHPRVDKRAYEDLCSAAHVYLIKVIPKIDKIILQPVKPKGKRLELAFKTDIYTPTTRLPKNGIILATTRDLSKAHDFIATGTDAFYTVRRQRKSRRKLQRTLRRKCKTLRQRKKKVA